MPCDSVQLGEEQIEKRRGALARLEARLTAGVVSVKVGPSGAIAFQGWQAAEREGLADLCAYRRLLASNSPALRRAVARAETLAGQKVNARAIAAGVHSHDGGATWGRG